MQKGQYEEAKNTFDPYVQMMRQTSKRNYRLFFTYSLAQLYTADIDGFIETYSELQSVTPVTKEEEEMKKKLEETFLLLMEEMNK